MKDKIRSRRDELATEYGIKVAKHFHDRLPSTKGFGIPQEEFDGKPDSQTKAAFEFGFADGFTLAVEMYKEVVEAAIAVAKRHNWTPNMGDCICQQHLDFETALARLKEEMGE